MMRRIYRILFLTPLSLFLALGAVNILNGATATAQEQYMSNE